MIRYAVRASPWVLLVLGCAAISGFLALVAVRPSVLWPLQGASVGVIAAIVAWSMDERCASIVDTLPRGLRWRTTARALAVIPAVLAVWIGCLVTIRPRIPDHPWLFTGQGVAIAGATLAVTVARRAAGTAEPGGPLAAAVMPLAAAVALARPLARWVAVFPIWPADNWRSSNIFWLALGVAVPLALLGWAVSRQPSRRRRYPPRCGRPAPAP
jgi:hypothetical protein